MATETHPSTKPASTPKSESFVEQQLAKVYRRVRLRDLATAALWLAVVVLAYGLTMSLADRLWDLAGWVRLSAWCTFALGVSIYLGFTVNRLCLRRVNPLYLAWQLERTVPGAKNSVINWLELRGEPLAPVIRGSMSRHAARDLKEADPEKAINFRPVAWLGGVAGVLLLLQLGWLAAAPAQVLSLLQRTLMPFDKVKIAARTELTLVKPESGDASVPANQPVMIRVKVQGYIPSLHHPDAVKLHFRYNPNEPFETRNLQQDLDGTWMTVVLADQVRNGFLYKITGGDAQLPQDREYRVEVRPVPQVQRFSVTHYYRPYLCTPDKKQLFDRNTRLYLKEMRGTETTLVVHANRPLKQCQLEMKFSAAKKDLLAGEMVPGDVQACKFQFVLDRDAELRVLFKSADGEDNTDREAYIVEVIPDRAPQVTVTQPMGNLTLPANGTLQVNGFAEDDHGVKSMQLRLKVLKAPAMPELKPKVYREGTSFELLPGKGKYPSKLDYSDYVGLETLQTAAGQSFPLAAGMELEYWLEARDNCDYPDKNGNLGHSVHYKVSITEPEKNKAKVADDRAKAEQQTKDNKKKQDEKLDGQKLQAEAQQKADGSNAAQPGLDKDSKQVQDAINNQQKKDDSPGQAKGPNDNNGGAKEQGPGDGSGQGNAKNDSPGPKDNAGQDKGQGNQGKGNSSGEAKDNPGQQQSNAPSTAKDGGQPKDDKQPPGTAKADARGNNSPGEAKGGSKDNPGQDKTLSKDTKPDSASQNKGPGDQATSGEKQQVAGAAKGQTTPGNSPPKDAGNTVGPDLTAKGGEPPPKDSEPNLKTAPPSTSKDVGASKSGDRKDAKLEDVAKLKDQLGDPKQSDQAQNGLEKIEKEASDPKVRDAANQALQEARAKQGQQPGEVKTAGPPGSKDARPATDKGQGQSTNPKDANSASAKEGAPKGQTGQQKGSGAPDKTGESAKASAKKPGSGNPGTNNKGTVGLNDPAGGAKFDPTAAARAGDLQLENLKKQIDKLREKIGPAVMKELGWTPKEREEYLRKVLAELLLREQQKKIAGKNDLPLPGSLKSLLSNTGPRDIVSEGDVNNQMNPLQRYEAPPEVREAYRVFQNPPAVKKK